MAADERDVPVSSDYAKSTATQKPQLPPMNPKMLIGAGVAVVLVVGGLLTWSHFNADPAASNPLAARPGFATLKMHVQSLAEIDGICSAQDKLACYCELADRIRSDRQAIDSLLATDPELKNFQIPVRRPASVVVSYDLSKLPTAPGEAECLNAVSAPTIIDNGSGTDSDGESAQ